jgi:formylglycine-generating enzyme required for sulfatase activity
MGCNAGELGGACLTDEQPRHTVTLGEYCMEETEVSVEAFRACASAAICTGTPTATIDEDWCNWSTGAGPREAHPVNCINWTDAQQYCRLWMGGDLPTEAQWEKAARGTDQRQYPWGNTPEPDCTRCNFDANGTSSGRGCAATESGPGTWEVGHIASTAGDSPYGFKDLAGNLWEWVADWYGANYYDSCVAGCSDPLNTDSASGTRTVRGGSFYHPGPGSVRVVNRLGSGPSDPIPSVGFRCRRTP